MSPRPPNVRDGRYLAPDSYSPTLTRGGPRNGVRSTALDSSVPQPIRDYFTAMNAFNSEGMIAPFTDDGLVNDIQREF
jgi:hypothetical protein